MYTRVSKSVNNVPGNLLLWGNPFDSNGKDVIVCIPGNPGIIDFYEEFASELHKRVGLPVCVIGHAGHEIAACTTSQHSYDFKYQEHLYNLEGQINHKLDFINNHLDKQSKLHLIGHSIGAWMIIELLDKNPYLIEKVSSINLLFPTIQRMAESPNGQFLTKVVKKIYFILIILITFLYVLPLSVCSFFINIYLKLKSLPPSYKERILKLCIPQVVRNTLLLAFEEMNRVTELNKDGIEKVKHLTNVIYSTRDGWAPVHYMYDLEQFQPPLQMKMVNVNHAFVLKSSERVAEMVEDFIKTKI